MTKTHQDTGTSVPVSANPSTFGLVRAGATAIKGVRVFDIGQGDGIGLLDQHSDPFCYVDYGGLGDHPDKGNPAHMALRMPCTAAGVQIPVVLTHWDKDHYWSAHKKNTAIQANQWLVPRQWASPQAVRFAARLTSAYCWPESLGNTTHAFAVGTHFEIQIRKCKKFDIHALVEDRNLSGLAITLIDKRISGSEQVIVLPGDCHFDAIPSFPGYPIKALVAYHHGSGVRWSSATAATINHSAVTCEMAYSYGTNPYGHPNRANYAIPLPWNGSAETTAGARSIGLESIEMSW